MWFLVLLPNKVIGCICLAVLNCLCHLVGACNHVQGNAVAVSSRHFLFVLTINTGQVFLLIWFYVLP